MFLKSKKYCAFTFAIVASFCFVAHPFFASASKATSTIARKKRSLTHSFLRNTQFHSTVQNTWDIDLVRHESLLKNIVQREKDCEKTHRAVYHAHNSSLILLQDFFNLLYFWEYKQSLRPDYIFLRHWDNASPSATVNDFLTKYPSIYDNDKDIYNQILSVNFSLFGNPSNLGESTFAYFLSNRSIASAHGVVTRILEELFKKYNFNSKYINDLINLIDSFKTNTGALIQIFLPHKTLNSHVYFSKVFGTPFHTFFTDHNNKPIAEKDFSTTQSTYTKISRVITYFTKHPKKLSHHIFDRIQGRLLFTQQFLSPSSNDIKIFRYTTIPDTTFNQYHQKLIDIFNHIITEKNAVLHPSAGTPLTQPKVPLTTPRTTALMSRLTESVPPWIRLYFKKDHESLQKAIQESSDIHTDLLKNTYKYVNIVNLAIEKKDLSLIALLINKGVTFNLAQLYEAGDIERVKATLAALTTIDDINSECKKESYSYNTLIDLVTNNKDKSMLSLLIEKKVLLPLYDLYYFDTDMCITALKEMSSDSLYQHLNSPSGKYFLDTVKLTKNPTIISILIDKKVNLTL